MSETSTKKRKRTSSCQRGGSSARAHLGRYMSALDELRDFCGSELLSEEGLGNFFEWHRDLTYINNDDFIADNNIFSGYGFFFYACYNRNINVGILRCLLNYFPNAAKDSSHMGTPLHAACYNGNVTPEIVQLLLDAAPESVCFRLTNGLTPLHSLCMNRDIDKVIAFEIMKILLEKYPETAGMTDGDGYTPLHCVCFKKHVTLDIVNLLLKAAPESVCSTERGGSTPLHNLCANEDVDKATAVDILKLLLEGNSEVAGMTNADGLTPLHSACANKNVTVDFVKLLLDAAPESVRSTTEKGTTPTHLLWSTVDKVATFEILKVLLKENSNVAGMPDAEGYTPLHYACMSKNVTLEIVELLLDASPQSVCYATDEDGKTPLHLICSNDFIGKKTTIEVTEYLLKICPKLAGQSDSDGYFPLHFACRFKTKEVCSLLVQAYPNAVNQRSDEGYYPIHLVLGRGQDSVDIVEFLLDCDPFVTLQKFLGHSLLRSACHCYDESNVENVENGVQIINAIYDAHPDAIYDFVDSDTRTRMIEREEVRTFIEREVGFVRHAREMFRLRTRDENGQLPLLRALANNAALGSIKLLVKRFPASLGHAGSNGALPLHVACQHHNSSCVAQYLIDLEPTSIRSVDNDGNTALHLACQAAKYETIAMLLEKHDAVSLSKRNSDGKLPIDLLFESSEVDDRENAKYVGIVFCLLRGYPETIELGL